MKRILVTFCLSISLGLSNIFAKDMTEAECVNLLQSLFNNSELTSSHVKKLPLSVEKKSLILGIYPWFANNKRILGKLAHDLNQVGLLKEHSFSMKDKNEVTHLFQMASFSFINSYYRQGLLKSNSDELRKYVRFEILRTKALPNGLCKRYHYGAKDADFLSKTDEIQGLFYKALSVPELKEYISHYERCLTLAVDENIAVRKLTRFNSEMGYKAFETALINKLLRLPKKENERLTNAIVNPQSSNSLDVCDSMKLMLKTLDSLDGDPFIWATTNILTESAK